MTLPTLMLLVPCTVAAQSYSGVAAGVTIPSGALADAYDRGFTVRAQVGFSVAFVGTHLQAGWSRLPARGQDPPESADLDLYHMGAGMRLDVALFFLGLNGVYVFGDADDGFGVIGETGITFGGIEVVLDRRIDGDWRWWGLRAGIRF
jgi:hypothetical protein